MQSVVKVFGRDRSSGPAEVEGEPRVDTEHRSPRSPTVLLAAVGAAAVGFALRLPIVGFGLPYIWHPDEPSNVGTAARMVDHGSWNPHSFLYPSMLYNVIAVAGRIQKAIGSWKPNGGQTGQAMAIVHTSDPHLYLALRLLTVFLSVGICVIVFAICYLVTKRWWAAALGSLLMAVSPLMVVNGVFITPDTYAAFFTAVGLLCALLVLRRGRLLDYVLAGLAVGLGAGAKYDPALVGVSVLVAHVLRLRAAGPRRRSDEEMARPDNLATRRASWQYETSLLILAGVLSIVAFLFTTPGAIGSYHQFISNIDYVRRYYANGHAGITGSSFVFYMRVLAHQGFLFVLVGVLALISLLGAWRREAWVVMAFVVVYIAAISDQAVHYDRELLPGLVGVAILGGIGLATAWDSGRQYFERHPMRWRAGVPVVGVAVALAGLGVSAQSAVAAYPELTQHPRMEAQGWIYQHIPRGSTVVVEVYGPWIDKSRYHLIDVQLLLAAQRAAIPSDTAAIVMTENGSGRYLRNRQAFKGEMKAYAALTSRYCQAADFHDGPWIRIFVPCSSS